jgi:hypothetical protein
LLSIVVFCSLEACVPSEASTRKTVIGVAAHAHSTTKSIMKVILLQQQQQFITKKSEGQQRSGERKGKSRGTQRGIREKEQEKRRKGIGKKKHRKEDQGGRGRKL